MVGIRAATLIDREVTGYHGTVASRVEDVVFRQRFKPSVNDYDWLGHGIYFWEGSADHAIQWAVGRHGKSAAVVQATIRLGHCLDLLDTKYVPLLQTARRELEADCKSREVQVPVNLGDSHDLDCAIVEWVCTHHLEAETVRAAFRQGPALFPGSMFQDLTHIQIAVRDPSAIRSRIEKVYEIQSSSV